MSKNNFNSKVPPNRHELSRGFTAEQLHRLCYPTYQKTIALHNFKRAPNDGGKNQLAVSFTRIVLLTLHNFFTSCLYSLQQNCRTIGFHLMIPTSHFFVNIPIIIKKEVCHAVFVLLFCAATLPSWHSTSSSLIPSFLTLVLPSNHTQPVKVQCYKTESSLRS